MMRLVLVACMICAGTSISLAAEHNAAKEVSPHSSSDLRAGKQVFKAACAGCHKWHGSGGGGYGGAALSLRATQLDHEQIVETIACGRPATGMPYHAADAYRGRSCYGISHADGQGVMPPGPASTLTQSEIDDVASYVLETLKGKGKPTLEECVAFWGPTSGACNEFRPKNARADDTHP